MRGLLGTSIPLAGLLAAQQAVPAPVPVQAPPVSVQRPRVNGWRVLDRVLGGKTITEGLDAERARLEAEANRPAQQALEARLAALASDMGPTAELAFRLAPEKFGAGLSEQFAPQVVAEGGLQSVYGSGGVVRNPRIREFGMNLVRDTPQGIETVATREPTYQEQTARQVAEENARIAAGNLGVAQGRLALDQNNSGFTLTPGGQRYDANGQPIAENTNLSPQAEAAQQERAQKTRAASQANIRSIDNTLNAVSRALDQTSGWTAGPLSALSRVPGTPQANLAATLDTIEANLAFSALAEMRANSPTGGALGGIAVRELDLLGATLANLRQAQSPSQLRENLNTVRRSLSALREIYQEQQQAGSAQPQQSQGRPTPEQARAILRARGVAGY